MSDKRSPYRSNVHTTERSNLGNSRRNLSTAEAYRQEAQLDTALYKQNSRSNPTINETVLAYLINAVLMPKFDAGEVATDPDAMLIRSLIKQVEEVTRAEWTMEQVYNEGDPKYFEGMSYFEQDPLSDETLLKRAFDPNEYAYYDYYTEPPFVLSSGTSGSELRIGITQRMVTKRFLRLRRLIRRYGVRQGWSEERITQAIKKSAYPTVDPDDPQISRYQLW
jgi:hypothetical protein